METKYQQAAYALSQVGYETIVSDQNLKIRAVTLSLNAPKHVRIFELSEAEVDRWVKIYETIHAPE